MFKMPLRVELCVNPLKRIGGKLPFKRAAKGKDKTRKQMQRMKRRIKILEEQVSGYMHFERIDMAEKEALQRQNFDLGSINAKLLDENKRLQTKLGCRAKFINSLLAAKARRDEFYVDWVKELEQINVNQKNLLADVQHVNELLRGRITRKEELAALDRERIAQQAKQIQDLRETLRALGHEV